MLQEIPPPVTRTFRQPLASGGWVQGTHDETTGLVTLLLSTIEGSGGVMVAGHQLESLSNAIQQVQAAIGSIPPPVEPTLDPPVNPPITAPQ